MEFAKGDDEGKPTPFDFKRFVPYPERFVEQDRIAEAWSNDPNRQPPAPKDGFNAGGHEWCVQHWGTKWNPCRVKYDKGEEYQGELVALIHFDTAWSPPKPVIRKAAEMFPDLNFDLRYFECGAGFNGRYRCQEGQVCVDKVGDYFGERGG